MAAIATNTLASVVSVKIQSCFTKFEDSSRRKKFVCGRSGARLHKAQRFTGKGAGARRA